ncbi:MAG: hypothetical protein EOO10_20910 [Chitinophagaceae bacterium]|nr:MAG: hypothetical protein EOO10_20910 [Chitinophagaceae bacterium]
MCRFQDLYVGEEGYVVRCKTCRHYHLLFGGVILCMTENEFQKFGRTVAACQHHLLTWKEGTDRPLPTVRQGVHLLLNQQKMVRLHAILEATTQTMLQLFEANGPENRS